MKINNLSLFAGLALLLFAGCGSDDNTLAPIVSPDAPVFILNAGKMGNNDASLTMYDPTGQTPLADDLFFSRNNKRLGDVGQDMVVYDSELFVSVSRSKVIYRLGNNGAEKAWRSMAPHGQPRYLAAKDGKLYVTTYGKPGHVFRLDAKTLVVEDSVAVGYNPENIVASGSKLYVANTGWGSGESVSVIDIPSFAVTDSVKVGKNPNDMLAYRGDVYVISWGQDYKLFSLQRINTVTLKADSITKASKMAAFGDTLYLACSITDYSTTPTVTSTSFATYTPSTGQVKSAVLGTGDVFAGKNIYLFDIHPGSGQIYVGTTDYATNGSIYVLHNRRQVDTFTSGGINPCKAVFVNP